MNNLKYYTVFVTLALFTLSACSTNKPQSASKKTAHKSKSTISALDLKTITPLDKIIPKLVNNRVVFVGELHTKYAHHLNQLAVIKGVHKHWKQNTSIGLEMVQQPYQSYLDKYIAAEISERQMLKGVEWYERWKFDFRLYRPIFNYAKKNRIPLVALNIPRELTKRISKSGIKGLNQKERSQLPKTIDRSNTAYKERMKNVFGMHSHTSSKGFEKFLEAQLAWDEGMAFAASKYLKSKTAKRMVIIVGGGHIINREGIPDRLERLAKIKTAVVLNHSDEILSSEQGDYLLMSPEIKLPAAARIGIFMKDTDKGLLVSAVSPHSAATKAGIKKGDILLALDNHKVKSSSDVRLWTLDKSPGDTVVARLKRKTKIVQKKLRLKGNSNPHSMMQLKKH